MPSDIHEAANTTKEGGIAWFCPLKLYRHYSGCRIWSGLLYRNYIKLYVSFCVARPGFVAYLFVVQCTTAVLCRCFYIRFVLPLIPAGSFISGGDFFLFSRYLISAVSCFPEAGFTTSFLNHFFLFSYCYQRIVVLLHTIPAISGRIPGSRRTAICHIFCRHWLFMSIYDYNWQGIPSYIYSFFLCGVGRQSATGNVRLTKHPVITWN